MRYGNLIPLILLCPLAGCTPKITPRELNDLQSSARQQALANTLGHDQAGIQLWYLGSPFGYDYYHYEYDERSGGSLMRTSPHFDHVEKTYRIRSSDDRVFDLEGGRRFGYTKDRSKWRPDSSTRRDIATQPSATQPSSITLDDLHT